MFSPIRLLPRPHRALPFGQQTGDWHTTSSTDCVPVLMLCFLKMTAPFLNPTCIHSQVGGGKNSEGNQQCCPSTTARPNLLHFLALLCKASLLTGMLLYRRGILSASCSLQKKRLVTMLFDLFTIPNTSAGSETAKSHSFCHNFRVSEA